MEFDFFAEAAARTARRKPFATATVVVAERPTSAKPGAKAIVTAEGKLLGWIGGSCAAPVVTREALEALATGEPRLIAISAKPAQPRDGVRHFAMTCHSGGALEIYIEPVLPAEQLVVVGRTPVAHALAALGRTLGLHVVEADADALGGLARTVDARTAAVVATRGEYDEDAVRAALATPARYIALVASRTRGDVLVEALADAGVPRDALARLKYPAGLDIHARSEEEIALSILAELIATRPAAAASTAVAPSPVEAIDPSCGMVVAITADALRAVHDDVTYYFCGAGCQRAFLKDPASALTGAR